MFKRLFKAFNAMFVLMSVVSLSSCDKKCEACDECEGCVECEECDCNNNINDVNVPLNERAAGNYVGFYNSGETYLNDAIVSISDKYVVTFNDYKFENCELSEKSGMIVVSAITIENGVTYNLSGTIKSANNFSFVVTSDKDNNKEKITNGTAAPSLIVKGSYDNDEDKRRYPVNINVVGDNTVGVGLMGDGEYLCSVEYKGDGLYEIIGRGYWKDSVDDMIVGNLDVKNGTLTVKNYSTRSLGWANFDISNEKPWMENSFTKTN